MTELDEQLDGLTDEELLDLINRREQRRAAGLSVVEERRRVNRLQSDEVMRAEVLRRFGVVLPTKAERSSGNTGGGGDQPRGAAGLAEARKTFRERKRMTTTRSAITFVKTPPPLLAEILAEVVPSWKVFDNAFDLCRTQRIKIAEAAKLDRAGGSVVDRFAQQLLRGEPFPAAFVDDLVRAEHAEAAPGRAGAVVDQVENQLVVDRDEAVRGSADMILRALGTRLDQTVTAARSIEHCCPQHRTRHRPVGRRGRRGGRPLEWAEFVKVRTEHHLLRSAQNAATRHLNLPGLEHLDTFGYFRDYAEVLPGWNEGRRSPWPEDPADRFRWLVDHPEVSVWVPTSAQLVDAIQMTAHREIRNGKLEARRA